MPLYILNKRVLVLCLFVFWQYAVKAQQVIKQVQLQKTGVNNYKVQYQLKQSDSLKLQDVTVKIFRRRSGEVSEVFSREMNFNNPGNAGQWYTFNWQADTALVRAGDELQARVHILYSKPAKEVKPPPVTNLSPKADAGADIEIQLPYQNRIYLNGLRSYDEDGKIVQILWRQVGGPTNLSLSAPDFYKTDVVGELKEGTYIFELTVTDNLGSTTSDRMSIIVKPVIDVKPPPVVSTPPPVIKKDTVQKPAVVKRTYEMPKLKGGPGNAFVNLLLPGLGHYYVSGDHYGNDRKPQVLLISALYAGSIGGAVYYKLRSINEYNKYKQLSEFREYQRDANGVVIGIRGANQAHSNQYLNASKTSHKNFMILTGISAGILAADFVYTFFRGLKNQRAWKREAGVQVRPFVLPGNEGMSVGIILNFDK
jgi:hypothetical protein